jgi:hypothetical protein
MSQHDITFSIFPIKVEYLTRFLRIFSQRFQIAKSLNPVHVASTTPTPLNEVNDVHVSPTDRLVTVIASLFEAMRHGIIPARISHVFWEAVRHQ